MGRLHPVAVLRGSRGAMAPGPALMVAKRGPTPKKQLEIVKKKGPADVFGPGLVVPKTAPDCILHIQATFIEFQAPSWQFYFNESIIFGRDPH